MIKFLSDPDAFSAFESTYLQLREKEGRILTDDQVRMLPYIRGLNPQLDAEWKFRANSFDKLKKYFIGAREGSRILDLGCGNGWTAAGLAGNKRLQLFAVDVNRQELEQADRVFSMPNLQFYFGDILSELFEPTSFQYIVMNACMQYFPDLDNLINRLFHFLEKGGEIHIVDTPIYDAAEVPAARKRSEEYYSGMGFPEMVENYFHHSWEDLRYFQPERMDVQSFLTKLLMKKTPGNLCWIKIKKR